MIFGYETQDVIREKNQEIKRLRAIIDALIFQVDDLKGALEMERFWNRCDEEALAEAEAAKMKAKPKAQVSLNKITPKRKAKK